jgi:hypothetical protein
MSYDIEQRREVLSEGIVSDDVIRLRAPVSRSRYPGRLRLVSLETAEGERLEFLTIT